MTIMELVVVLAIFAVLSLVVIYNYGNFQSKVDIQDLTSGIALQVVQAQNSSLSGLTTAKTTTASPWKPTYGVYFSTVSNNGADNKDFIYFVDLNDNYQFDGAACDGFHECESKYTVTKGNYIYSITTDSGVVKNDLTVTFTRPNSGATFYSGGVALTGIAYMQITVKNQTGTVSSSVNLYPSGRIQIN